MNFDLHCGEHERARHRPDDIELQKVPAPGGTAPAPSVDELAELLRDLHQLLESYAPQWYSAQLDSRVRKMLARVDRVSDLRS